LSSRCLINNNPKLPAPAEETTMADNNGTNPLDRRRFLAASAATLIGTAGAARAQAPQAAKVGEGGTKLTARVVDFVANFDLGEAPPLAIERARTAFIETVGVMLAGSRSDPAAIVLEMVRAEGRRARGRDRRPVAGRPGRRPATASWR